MVETSFKIVSTIFSSKRNIIVRLQNPGNTFLPFVLWNIYKGTKACHNLNDISVIHIIARKDGGAKKLWKDEDEMIIQNNEKAWRIYITFNNYKFITI